jgi:hypothetical protein
MDLLFLFVWSLYRLLFLMFYSRISNTGLFVMIAQQCCRAFGVAAYNYFSDVFMLIISAAGQ